MPVEILMPALSPTMKEGNLVKWVKKEGDTIVSGDILAEIETDKATMEVEAVDEGKLVRILIPAGTQNVKVNEVIALILEEDEDEGALTSYKGPSKNLSCIAESSQPPLQTASTSLSKNTEKSTSSSDRKFASPLARRIAEQNNINLSTIEGSGPRNRVIKADIEATLSKASKGSLFTQPALTSEAVYQDLPLTTMRKVIAQRLTESKQHVPHFYLSIDCEIDTLLNMRKSLNASLELEGIKVSVNDFVIKACATALQKVPAANSSWMGDFIRYYTSSNISVAVAIEGGLITPILKAAHLKSLTQISQEMKELAKRAREGKLKPEEFQGGSFSISNLGMYGIKDFAAVINPPQGAILAVGAGEQRPIIRNNEIKGATLMTCTLSVDHRAIDGAVGSEFLGEFKKFMENPLLMLA